MDEKTVMVVDDDVFNLKIAEKIISKKYKVVCVNSGAALFQALETIMPSIILLDVLMPEMDGFDVLKKLKESEKYKNIKVAFLTADDDENTHKKGIEAGAVDFILKPFRPDVLLNAMAKLL